MCDICGDNRFELIEKYKQKLLDATNIGDSPEEMAVIDNILFRFWQMGWLEKLELFGNSKQLDTISRAGAIETVRKAKSIGQAHRMLMQLPSARLASSESIIDTITTAIDDTDGDNPHDVGVRNGMRWCRQLFDKKEPEYEMPTARKKGHWIDEGTNYSCSECHRGCWVNSNYCPWCGIRMRRKDGDHHEG